jgi:dienelactone hydrolase
MARRHPARAAARGLSAGAAVTLAAASGCSSSAYHAAVAAGSPTPSPGISADCISPGSTLAKRIVHFPSANGQETVEAYINGAGGASSRVGIVVDHQSGQTLCDSMGWADTFAQEGYLAVAPSLVESRQVTETEGAIAYLRAHGATQIILLGASMGGTAVLETAAQATLPVQAVISVSGPESYYPLDAFAAAPTLKVPVFYAAGSEDTGFASAATNLYEATAEKDKVLHIVQGDGDHGFDLIGVLLAPINAFIKSHTG